MGGIFDLPSKKKRLSELESLISTEDFWKDKEKAKKVLAERKNVEKAVKEWEALKNRSKDLMELFELCANDEEEMQKELESEIISFERELGKSEVKILLSGEDDIKNAILTIHPGAGGTESQDWAQMLMRMYLRWAERKDFHTEIVDLQQGDEAGIKNVIITINGEYAYGYLKAETGIHRLVRISPFDANKRRHTSFASVFVTPEVDDDITIEIKEDELKIDTFRAGGAGGQHVNKSDTAVRITHLPTGIVVGCQNERSQYQNKMTAMKILKSRLYELKLQEEKEKMDAIHSQKKDIAWGNQIRSYVLHPYRMVKDHRTGVEVGNADAVLDGDIDQFIESYLIEAGKQKQNS
ncbi:MAG: peptide chain release factor 2 [Candidatus Schekmanbacteria bacterium]|nr:MAG: peptide chain release factor 2 [Candidatus Schekmanbacteria bacterium]